MRIQINVKCLDCSDRYVIVIPFGTAVFLALLIRQQENFNSKYLSEPSKRCTFIP